MNYRTQFITRQMDDLDYDGLISDLANVEIMVC